MYKEYYKRNKYQISIWLNVPCSIKQSIVHIIYPYMSKNLFLCAENLCQTYFFLKKYQVSYIPYKEECYNFEWNFFQLQWSIATMKLSITFLNFIFTNFQTILYPACTCTYGRKTFQNWKSLYCLQKYKITKMKNFI